MTKKQKKNLIRILIAVLWLVLCNVLPLTGILRGVLFLGCYFFIGYDILRKAWLGIIRGNVFSESFLMAVATAGAIVLAVGEKTGDYNEAVAVMLFYQIGEWFQSYAVGKSRKNIAALMDIRPEYANLLQDGKTVQVSPDQVPVGSEILVHPGEKIPLDGIVVQGKTTLDTAALTGESLPREVTEQDSVLSGCINLTGLITVRTTGSFENSTVSKILELVENASGRKSKTENFTARFARVYTPFVCISALLLAVLPPLFGIGTYSMWIYRALTFLVISCPCALVISVPLSFFAAIGGASREGILIKGSNYLEVLADVRNVVLDKTGTLTRGEFVLTDILTEENPELLLEYAALAESGSNHPIAKSIVRAWGRELNPARIENLREQGGWGVTARIDGRQVALGNARMMESLHIIPPVPDKPGTVIYMAIDGHFCGCFLVSDAVKETAAEALKKLKKLGVRKTVMLTGDSKEIAEITAQNLGIDMFYAQLLPGDKVEKLEVILEKEPGKTAFVGDGINDAPVLTRADVGIAMGALGSDAAIEASDVVLMDDNPLKIPRAIQIARRCMAIVRQNVCFAVGIKLLCLILGAAGLANMWAAIFADVGVMVLAVLNAMRALQTKKELHHK